MIQRGFIAITFKQQIALPSSPWTFTSWQNIFLIELKFCFSTKKAMWKCFFKLGQSEHTFCWVSDFVSWIISLISSSTYFRKQQSIVMHNTTPTTIEMKGKSQIGVLQFFSSLPLIHSVYPLHGVAQVITPNKLIPLDGKVLFLIQ